MTRPTLPVLIGLLIAAPAAASEPDPLCAGLDAFVASVARDDAPVEIRFGKDEAWAPWCSYPKDHPAADAFCMVALANTSMEFSHLFPWNLDRCLRAEGVRVRRTTVNQYTGLRNPLKIVRMSGRFKSGVRLALVYVPNPDDNAPEDGVWRGYYGQYRVTLTPPAARSARTPWRRRPSPTHPARPASAPEP